MSEVRQDLNYEDINQRHRKEKRLLQAHIQGLKKSSGKLDKKKKKELDETISRLELELQQTQLKELSEITPENSVEGSNFNSDGAPTAAPAPRISKAQKRRDKKAAEESAREKMIAEQEIANINGPRNLELRAIKKTLEPKSLVLHMIPSNGDCLYGAIAHQLTVTGRPPMSIVDLRKTAADHIRSHKDNFVPFICDLDTGDMLSEEQFEKYCYDLETTKTWGGQVELQALSSALKCSIHVVQSESPKIIIQGEEFVNNGVPLILAYHRHMFGLGEHYNSTKKLEKDDNESNEELE